MNWLILYLILGSLEWLVMEQVADNFQLDLDKEPSFSGWDIFNMIGLSILSILLLPCGIVVFLLRTIWHSIVK